MSDASQARFDEVKALFRNNIAEMVVVHLRGGAPIRGLLLRTQAFTATVVEETGAQRAITHHIFFDSVTSFGVERLQ